jgi:D-alanyl-D-alanine carboxypeptidase
MEEASVAGESPDSSKQRESSAKPASGSAGPKAEARSDSGTARGTLDPRVALTGEGEGAGESGASGSTGTSVAAAAGERGGVDTATRVLSVREVVTAAGESGESSGISDKSGESGTSGISQAGAAEGDESREGSTSEAGRADGQKKTEDSATRAEKQSADAGGGKGALRTEGGKGVSRTEGGRPAGAASADSESEAAKPEKPEKAGTSKGGEPEKSGEPKGVNLRKAEAPAGGEPAKPGQPKAVGLTKDGAPEGGKSGEETAGNKADAKTDAKTDAKADAKTGAKTGATGEPKAETKTESKAGPRTDTPVDRPTAVFATPKRPAVDQPTTMLKLGGPTKDAKDPKDAEAAKGAEDAKGAKDVQDAPKTGARPAAGSRSGESDGERTSKFVALKPLDDPSTRKPQPRTPQAQGAQSKPPADAVGAADATVVVPRATAERTAQQPLPPKPPLDLLAELTNTPPPPQTPLRTLLRRIKIWSPVVVLLAIIFAVVQALRPLPSPTLALSAKDTFTFDGANAGLPWPDEGQGWMDVDGIGTMSHFGEQKPVAIGSVAKTMTAYIILRDHPLKPGQEGPKIKIDEQAEKEGGYDTSGESTLNTVKAGDYLTEKQALSAVMIPSANNIARLLARWDAGSEQAFVKKMNATAKELGMTNTTYTDPSGLTKTTVSTAQDQVKLGHAVVKVPALIAITSAASWTDPSGRYWPNYNELPYTMGAIGIKTGTTTAAGGNLLFASRKEVGGQTVTVVGAILAQHKGQSILETVNKVSKVALTAAQDALTSAKILKKGDVVGYVDDGLGGHTPVVVTKDVTAVGWAGLKVKLALTGNDLPHEAKAGTTVGRLTVGDGAQGAVQVPVALQTDLTEPGFTDKLTRLG